VQPSTHDVVVSIITPTIGGKRLPYLLEAIASVRAQTVQEWELIIVGDGADETTRAAVDRVVAGDHRIRCIWQSRVGLPAAENTGIRASSGRYVAFLDDDDLWAPEKLAKQVAVMEQDASIGLVATRILLRNEHLGEITGTIPEIHPPLPEGCTFRNLVKSCFLPKSSVMVRRQVLDQVGLFDPSLQVCEDYDLWLRVVKATRFTFLTEPLGTYRRHDGNISASWLKCVETTLQILPRVAPDPAHGVGGWFYRRTLARLHHLAANEYLDTDDWAPACRHLSAALRHNPLVGVDMTLGRNGKLSAWQRAIKPYRLLASHWLAMKTGRRMGGVGRQTGAVRRTVSRRGAGNVEHESVDMTGASPMAGHEEQTR